MIAERVVPFSRNAQGWPSRWREWSVTIVAGLLGAVIWIHILASRAGVGFDFAIYLQAAHLFAAGDNPYHRLIEIIQQQQTPGHLVIASGYVYPPLFALLLAIPIHLGMGDKVIWYGWNILEAMLLLAAMIDVARLLPPASIPRHAQRYTWRFTASQLGITAAAAMLLPSIAMYDLYLGQTDMLITALTVWSLSLSIRRSPWASLPLACAVTIKPTLLFMVVIWLWQRQWRTVVWTLLISLLLILGPFLFLPTPVWSNFWTFVIHWDGLQGQSDPINQALIGVVKRFFVPSDFTRPWIYAPWLVLPIWIPLEGGTLWLAARAIPRHLSKNSAMAIGAALLMLPLFLLVSMLAEGIHYCLLIPALLGLNWLAWTTSGVARWQRLTLALALAIFAIPNLSSVLIPSSLHALVLPGAPAWGRFEALVRTSIFAAIAAVTLLAGSALIRSFVSVPSVFEKPEPIIARVQPEPTDRFIEQCDQYSD